MIQSSSFSSQLAPPISPGLLRTRGYELRGAAARAVGAEEALALSFRCTVPGMKRDLQRKNVGMSPPRNGLYPKKVGECYGNSDEHGWLGGSSIWDTSKMGTGTIQQWGFHHDLQIMIWSKNSIWMSMMLLVCKCGLHILLQTWLYMCGSKQANMVICHELHTRRNIVNSLPRMWIWIRNIANCTNQKSGFA